MVLLGSSGRFWREREREFFFFFLVPSRIRKHSLNRSCTISLVHVIREISFLSPVCFKRREQCKTHTHFIFTSTRGPCKKHVITKIDVLMSCCLSEASFRKKKKIKMIFCTESVDINRSVHEINQTKWIIKWIIWLSCTSWLWRVQSRKPDVYLRFGNLCFALMWLFVAD